MDDLEEQLQLKLSPPVSPQASPPVSPRALRESSSTRRKRLEFELKAHDRDYTDHWDSCLSRSGKTDRRLVQYSCKMVISAIVLGVSLHQLITGAECDNLEPFWCSVISFILGMAAPETVKKK